PRVDLMFGVNKEMVRNRLGIDDDKQVILYAPTWRGTLGNKDNQSQKILDDVKEMQEKCQNATVLVKAHHYAQEIFKKQGEGHLLVPNTIDTNEVLSIIDILIMDYSSVCFEFLPTQRRVIFYSYNEKKYQPEDVTYKPMNELPGPLCHTIDEVIESIQRINKMMKQYKKIYERIVQEYCYHENGQATERFVDAVFEGKHSEHLFKI